MAVIGVFGIPSTIAYLSGQHSLYDISTSNCSNCHYSNTQTDNNTGIEAGGFGLTADPYDSGEAEVHKAWVMNGSNDACAGCHTDIAMEINFNKSYLIKFDATKSPDGVYSVSNFSVNGNVFVTYSNSSDNAFAVSNSTYGWAPDTNMYMNGKLVNVIGISDNAKVYGLNGTATDDSATALTNP